MGRTGFRAALLGVAGFALLMAPGPCWAAGDDDVEKIVAVVSDEAISEQDLEGAVHLAMVAGGFPDTKEMRTQLTPEILHNLVDDQLKFSEAKRLKVKVDREEIDGALKLIAEQRNSSVEQLLKELAKVGVPASALERQTRAQLAWRKVIQKEIVPRINISADEIDAAYARTISNIEKPQYRAAEIFLAVDSPDKDEQVRKFAEQIEDRLQHGADFTAVAQQFSQAAGAGQGGDLGVIQEGDFGDERDLALKNLAPNQISAPIRTQNGYHIIVMRTKGSLLAGDPALAEVHLKNVLLPFTEQPTKETAQRLMEHAKQVRATLPNCAAINERAKHDSLSGDLGKPDQFMRIADLRQDIAQAVIPLQVNQISQPVVTEDGIQLFMVCERKDPPKREPPTRDQVYNQIWSERVDLRQQRYLRDLRGAAFIDMRT